MIAANAIPSARAEFIRKTYAHLGGAILAFALIEMAIFQTSLPETIARTLGSGQWTWLLVLGAFMGISMLAHRWAASEASVEMQYAGLGAYVLAEAIIFVPLLYLAARIAGPSTIQSAALLTLMLFTGLTVTVFATQKDFSWMGSLLGIGGMVAIGVVVCSVLFGLNLGVIFAAAMVLLAAGSILYETSNVLHNYRTTQHVAASLALFAAIALLFWYILRIFVGFRRDD
jgi:hypothetical protein